MCRTISDKSAKVVAGIGQANCRSIRCIALKDHLFLNLLTNLMVRLHLFQLYAQAILYQNFDLQKLEKVAMTPTHDGKHCHQDDAICFLSASERRRKLYLN